MEMKFLGQKLRKNSKKGKKYPHLWRARVGSCLVCKSEYRATGDFKNRKQKYCSKKCWSKRRIKLKCFVCSSEIESYHAKKFCSKKCQLSFLVGENAPSYKDGKSLERDRARLGSQIKEWRKSVFRRDYFKCQHCGSNKKLHAHHIKEWAYFPDLRFELNNGLTLCEICHGKVHGKNFANRKSKSCSNCKSEIRNQSGSGLCASCAIKKNWKERKAFTGNKSELITEPT